MTTFHDSQTTFRILSVDGSGPQSVVPCCYITKLHELGIAPAEHFNLLASSSMGSIIVCGLASGKEPAEILEFFQSTFLELFDEYSWGWGLLPLSGTKGYTYPICAGEKLEDGLKTFFGTEAFHGVDVPTMVITFNLSKRRPKVFKSWEKRRPDDPKVAIWEVCKAACSTPVMFPPHAPEENIAADQEDVATRTIPDRIADGAIVFTNPTLCSIAESLKSDTLAKLIDGEILVASMGIGKPKVEHTDNPGGLESWKDDIVDVLLDGSNASVQYIAEQLIPDKQRLFRFQPILSADYQSIVPAKLEDIAGLIRDAESDIERSLDRLKALKHQLNSTTKSPSQLEPKADTPKREASAY